MKEIFPLNDEEIETARIGLAIGGEGIPSVVLYETCMALLATLDKRTKRLRELEGTVRYVPVAVEQDEPHTWRMEANVHDDDDPKGPTRAE